MLENFTTFFKKMGKKEQTDKSKDAAKERLHLVLIQDRANVSADFLEMMKQEIVDVIKKYIDVDEGDMDVKLTNKSNDDGTSGAPALYANIPIVGIKEEKKKESEELTKAKKAEEIKDKKETKPKTTKSTTKKTVSAKKSTTKTAKTTKKVTAKSTKSIKNADSKDDKNEDEKIKTVKTRKTTKKSVESKQ